MPRAVTVTTPSSRLPSDALLVVASMVESQEWNELVRKARHRAGEALLGELLKDEEIFKDVLLHRPDLAERLRAQLERHDTLRGKWDRPAPG